MPSQCSVVRALVVHSNTVHGFLFGTEAQHGKYHQGGQHRGEEVDAGDGEGVTVTVVLLGIVGGVGDDGSETQAQSEEDLRGRLSPHLHVGPDLQL